MFIILLKFSANKSAAGQYMDSHNAWIKKGFEDGVFLLTGTIQPKQGGGVIAHGVTRGELQERVNADPFVAKDVVAAEIIEITPGKTDERLSFLQG
ncbi:MAG: hypothetical protein KTR19_08250 [Hyphomicrobiales bacterium]|nr:hypothetical protein [Hyphomicrobiales bacterium]